MIGYVYHQKNTNVINDFYKDCNELKVIIQNNHDFKWAEIQRNKLKRDCFMYLQPEWSKSKIILQGLLIMSRIIQNGKFHYKHRSI